MDNTLSLKVDTPIGSVNMLDDRLPSGEVSADGQQEVNIHQGQSETMEHLCGALEHALKDLQRLRESIFNSHREQIAQLSVAIAEKILCKEISTENYEIEKIISKALGAAPAGEDIVIRLNPQDYQQYQRIVSINDTPGAENIKIVADANIKPAECIVETSEGNIEYFIEENLNRIAEALKGKE